METNKDKKIEHNTSCIDVYLGSVPKVIRSVFSQKAKNSGRNSGYQNEYCSFDFTNKIPADLLSSLKLGISEIDIDRHISAHAPVDKSSLRKAEESGRMWVLDDGWLSDPGLFQDNGGGAGRTRSGYALAVFNEKRIKRKIAKTIRRILDHVRQSDLADNGITENTRNSRVVIRLFFSATGATGSGSIHKFLDGIVRDCAAKAGVEAKIIVCMLLRGNLSVPHPEKATLNELTTCKTIRTKATGAYVNSLTGIIEPVPFDVLFVSSNINNSGNIISLDRLLCHEGQMIYFEQKTPGGNVLAERFCDIQSWQYDDQGDPEVCFTKGIAIISRDHNRVIGYLSLISSALLAQSCLAQSDLETTLSQAAALARRMKIVETEEENLISRSILYPDELDGESVCDRAAATLTDRLGNASGINRILILQDALNSIANTDLNTIYEVLMQEKARNHVEKAIETAGQGLQQLMKKPQGLSETKQSLQAIRTVLEKASQSLSEKINELQEQIQPHEEIIAEITEHLQQIRQMNFMTRSFQLFSIRSMAETFEESARALVNYCTELAVCTIALQDVVMPLIDWTDNKSGWILAQINKLQKLERLCDNKADQLVKESAIFQAPVGREITDKQYLQGLLEKYIHDAGGLEEFKGNLRQLFLNKYRSLAAFSETSMKETVDAFCDFCGSIYSPDIKGTDVLDELFRIKDIKVLKEIATQLILQSDGRALTQGQADEYIPRIKIATVPSEKHVPEVKKLLESLDANPGKWQIVVNSADKDTFSVVQVRGKLTLTQFIKGIDLPDTYENWKILIDAAVDPVAAISVPPNPTPGQLKRVLTKAVAAGLVAETEKGFTLKTYTGKSILLGEIDSATQTLQHKFRDIVFIESVFARNLVVDEDSVMAKLNNLIMELENTSDQSGPLLALIDSAAVNECIQQAELLLPRLRRIRKAIEKRPSL